MILSRLTLHLLDCIWYENRNIWKPQAKRQEIPDFGLCGLVVAVTLAQLGREGGGGGGDGVEVETTGESRNVGLRQVRGGKGGDARKISVKQNEVGNIVLSDLLDFGYGACAL